jgi:hypothetical protein
LSSQFEHAELSSGQWALAASLLAASLLAGSLLVSGLADGVQARLDPSLAAVGSLLASASLADRPRPCTWTARRKGQRCSRSPASLAVIGIADWLGGTFETGHTGVSTLWSIVGLATLTEGIIHKLLLVAGFFYQRLTGGTDHGDGHGRIGGSPPAAPASP